MIWALLFGVLSVLVVGAWWTRRQEIRQVVDGRRSVVSDEVLDQILGEGRVELSEPGYDDGPLDEEAAREAEDRFWEEDWDEPEEFRP
ncbi:MAG: hypothetical protein EA352_09530 [Gemmatimonadales bacterium]|nr:MAG: hypothetical protein EA352_09530 [Gemmatimonadales bacterium]